MNDKAFPTPVELRLEHNIRKVSTVFEALECLLGPWPITTCREYRSAVRACRDCLDGLRSPVAAYRAFKAASRVAEALLAKAAPGRWIVAQGEGELFAISQVGTAVPEGNYRNSPSSGKGR